MSPRVEVAPHAVDGVKCVHSIRCVSLPTCPPACVQVQQLVGMWSWAGCIVTSEHH